MSRAARAYVADVTRTAPKRRAFTLHVNRQVAVQEDRKAQVTRDAAAYDAMAKSTAAGGTRPLKPPCALPANMPTVRSVGARGLEPTRLRADVMHWTGEGWRS